MFFCGIPKARETWKEPIGEGGLERERLEREGVNMDLSLFKPNLRKL
jgi:hypothetical protein